MINTRNPVAATGLILPYHEFTSGGCFVADGCHHYFIVNKDIISTGGSHLA